MKNLATQTGSSQKGPSLEAFQNWFEKWAESLWSFVHFNALSSDEFSEDFLDVLHVARPKISKSILRDSTGQDAVGVFLKIWFSRLQKGEQHSSQHGLTLTWEDQFLLYSVFRKNWSYEFVAKVMRLPLSAVKFRLFTALSKEAKISQSDFAHLSRECARFDLYFVDLLLNQKWSDPLHLIDRSEISKHGEHCTRCRGVQEALRLCVDQLRSRPVTQMPETYKTEIREEFGTRWQLLFSGEWFSDLPWGFRVPLQAGIAGLAIWGVLLLSAQNPSMAKYIKSGEKVFSGMQNKVGDIWTSARTTLSEWVDGWKDPSVGADAASPQTASADTQAPASSGYLSQGPKYNEIEFLKFALAKKEATPIPTPDPLSSKLDMGVAKVDGGSSKGANSTAAAAVTAPATAPSASAASTASNASTAAADENLFHRWFARTGDLDGDREKILAILKKYEAVKAGDLALGGNYQGGKYFHFSVKKEVFDAVYADIKAIGLKGITTTESRSGTRKTLPGHSRAVFILMPLKDAASSGTATGASSSEASTSTTLPDSSTSTTLTPSAPSQDP